MQPEPEQIDSKGPSDPQPSKEEKSTKIKKSNARRSNKKVSIVEPVEEEEQASPAVID